MKTHYGIITDNKFKGKLDLRVSVTHREERFFLRVYSIEGREGFFVLQPVGSINTLTSSILQKEVEPIYESKPKIILFDMGQVDFINSKGLSVILKAHQAMKLRGRRVGLMNFQPHIKKVFDIVNALPMERVFADRHELDNYLNSMQNKYFSYSHIVNLDPRTDDTIIWAESDSYQGIENSSRAQFG